MAGEEGEGSVIMHVVALHQTFAQHRDILQLLSITNQNTQDSLWVRSRRNTLISKCHQLKEYLHPCSISLLAKRTLNQIKKTSCPMIAKQGIERNVVLFHLPPDVPWCTH